MSKKILYISYDGMTDPLGQSQVIPYLRELTKLGYEFTLLSVEKKMRMETNGGYIRQLLAEAGIRWTTISFTSKPPVLSKIYDQLRLNAKAARLHKKEKFDLIHCRSYVAAAAGLQLTKRFQVPFLFDMRGFWVDERVDSGLWDIKNPLYKLFYNIYKKKERQYLAHSAHIISLTHKGQEELIKAYQIKDTKISVIPCCADLEHFDYRQINDLQKAKVKAQLNIDTSKKVLTYLGSLGGWYMTSEMLDFFVVLKTKIPDVVFLFITQDKKEDIIKLAVSKGIFPHDIRVQPASRNEVPAYLSVSNWSIFFIKDVYSKMASSPTKQGEIMAMGIPLICNDIGDTGKIISETQTGIVIKNFTNTDYITQSEKVEELKFISKEKIREAAFTYYNLEKGVNDYLRVYKMLFNE